MRSGAPRELPAEAGAASVHPESGWRAAADRGTDAGRQGGPRRGGRGAERHLRGRLSGVLLRVSAGTSSSRGTAGAAHGTDDAVRELGARRGHSELLRLGGPRVDASDGRASGGRPASPAADTAMAAGGRDGRPGGAGDGWGGGAGGGGAAALGRHFPALFAR